MVFLYEEKVIIKYLRIKYKYSTTRIVNDHPEYEWNVNGVKELLKEIEETGDVARKKVSEWPKSVHTEENIKLVREMILIQAVQSGNHFTPAETACEFNIESQPVYGIIDQDLDFRPLRKRKVQKPTDSNIEKCIFRFQKVLT